MSILAKTPNGMTLYAVAVERYSPKYGWSAGFEYLHAYSQGDARLRFTVAEPNRDRCRIVGIAPVVGYNVHDNHGDKLSV